jgi:5-methylcytosine-specific restriction enzyme A
MLCRVVAANTVDHKRSIASGGDPFPPLDGLMSMCAGCHARKTNALDNRRLNARRDGVAFVGVDVNGFPIDPRHPFFPIKGEGEG